MAKWHDDDVIRVLSCEIDARPEAPGPAELAPFIKAASMGPDAMTLEIDEAGVAVAERFVAAERVCCSTIGWEVVRSPRVTLRIAAAAPQLRVLAALVPQGINIEKAQ